MVEIRDTSSRGHTLPGDLCQWFTALNPAFAFSMIWRGIRGRTLPVAAWCRTGQVDVRSAFGDRRRCGVLGNQAKWLDASAMDANDGKTGR
jgi:hypothetical protein